MYYAMVAFGSTLLFLGALRRSAHRYGLVDRPDRRKTHLGDIPVVGGLAIGGAFLTTCFLLGSPSAPFVTACIILLATGLFDDLNEFSARGKFVGQLAAAVIMTSWGDLFLVDLGDLWGHGDVMLGNWAIPFTLFCVVGLMNAMNMIDGLDGLAGGTGLIASVWLCVAAGKPSGWRRPRPVHSQCGDRRFSAPFRGAQCREFRRWQLDAVSHWP